MCCMHMKPVFWNTKFLLNRQCLILSSDCTHKDFCRQARKPYAVLLVKGFLMWISDSMIFQSLALNSWWITVTEIIKQYQCAIHPKKYAYIWSIFSRGLVIFRLGINMQLAQCQWSELQPWKMWSNTTQSNSSKSYFQQNTTMKL